LKNNQDWIGWDGDVLFDERTDRAIKGRNFAYKPIFVNEPVKIGEKHSVEIVDATTHSLVAKIVS
jgi:tRNA A37 methylthiotransferase MiaB